MKIDDRTMVSRAIRSTWIRRASCALALAGASSAQVGTVRSQLKISETSGGGAGLFVPFSNHGTSAGTYYLSIGSVGDLDGDGVSDLALGQPGDNDGGTKKGALWLVYLNADGSVRDRAKISSTSGGLGSLGTSVGFGSAVAALGDLDDDGVVDLAVGARRSNEVWILFLNADGTVRTKQKISNGTPLWRIDFGAAVAGIGDLDRDGTPDLAVGAPRDDYMDATNWHGSLWILFLNPDGTVKAEHKIGVDSGFDFLELYSAEFGSSLALLSDIHGEGPVQLAVGAPKGFFNHDPAVWTLTLETDGTVVSKHRIDQYGGGLPSDPPVVGFGSALAPLGDLDADGVVDLAAGAEDDDAGGANQGAVWILFLQPDHTLKAIQKISATNGNLGPVLDPQDFFGSGAASVGDLDGDGVRELAVAALGDDDGGADKGAVHMLSLKGHVRLDFEREDDFETRLANGQDISTPPEFGRLVSIASAGPNAGAALFDSTPGGPNDPSQDRDLLVDSGKILILQTNANTTQTVPGLFDRPNDDQDGGTLSIAFPTSVSVLRIDLVDIDLGTNEATVLNLTDTNGRTRSFSVPPGWTGDLLEHGVGSRTLSLLDMGPQVGFGSTATMVQDAGFDPRYTARIDVHLGGSGGVDNLVWRRSPPLGARGVHASPRSPHSPTTPTLR